MPSCRIDHFVVTAPNLSTGAEFIRQRLGVEPQQGGRHLLMGTHNLLLRLGESLYLEVISPDPQATVPTRSRWFGLDHLAPSAEPSLSSWVIRTADISATIAQATESLGDIELMSRGSFRWLITIPNDGIVPLDGVGPALIEWDGALHPAAGLENYGLSLAEFDIFHPDPNRITQLLASIGLKDPINVAAPVANTAPGLFVRINTLTGPRCL